MTDDQRPLNEEGERESVHVGIALRRLKVEPTAFITSPLVRARRTAELAAAQLGSSRTRHWGPASATPSCPTCSSATRATRWCWWVTIPTFPSWCTG
jgi:phosphohistidine phosphatase SixA